MEPPITSNRAREIVFERLQEYGMTKQLKAEEISDFFVLREVNGKTKLWEYRRDFEAQIEKEKEKLLKKKTGVLVVSNA